MDFWGRHPERSERSPEGSSVPCEGSLSAVLRMTIFVVWHGKKQQALYLNFIYSKIIFFLSN